MMQYAVECFYRVRDDGGRPGVWVMTQPSGCRGMFLHGNRKEIQAPAWSVEQLRDSAEGKGLGPLLGVRRSTPEEVISLVESTWPEGAEVIKWCLERHRISSNGQPLKGAKDCAPPEEPLKELSACVRPSFLKEIRWV